MILHKIRSVGLFRLWSTYIYRAVISSSNQTYDKNLTLDKLQNEWMHHSPYFWLERMTFLVTFGLDMPEAGFRTMAKNRIGTHYNDQTESFTYSETVESTFKN